MTEPWPLEIPELLVQILSHLEPIDLQRSALLVNRQWAEICLDFLWYEVEVDVKLRHLFALLAPISETLQDGINGDLPLLTTTYKFDEKPSQNQLQRFEAIYASRVRAFSLPPGNIDITSILDDILLLQPKLPLLPNLITLNWNELSGNMADEAYAALFMHDGVRAFRIMHDSASTAFPDIFQHSAWYNARRIVFFGHISERMPNLDTLVVSLRPDPELKKPLFELIRSLPRLRNVVLPGFPDPIGVFSEIQNCCHLEQVSFSVDYDLHYWHQPASIATSLASISLPAFDKLETLSLRCGFGLASLILEHLFGHDPLRLTNLAVVSESEDTPFQVHKLCGSISQVGHRLKKLCLAGLRFYRPSHDTLCFLSESVIHFEDIKPILKCSNLESFELGYPFDLPWQEIKSIALAWPRLKSGGFYLLYKVHPHDPMAVKVRNWRHVVQKAFLSPDKQISDSRQDALSMHDTFNSIGAFPITFSLAQYSKIGKVLRHVAALRDGVIPLDTEFKFRERAQFLVDQWRQDCLHLTELKITGRDHPRLDDIRRLGVYIS